MATYVFIHGGYETGACFHRTAELLRRLGHEVHAPDLPPNAELSPPLGEVGLDAYRSFTAKLLQGLGEPAILVGHSLGGVTISATAELAPERVRDLVYLHALMLPRGFSVRTFRESFYGRGARLSDAANQRFVSDDGVYAAMGGEGAREHFYNACSLEEQEKGVARLREQPLRIYDDKLETTPERWGAIRRTYILGLRDQGLPPRFSAHMLETVGADRVEVIDSDHSSFLSTPERLVRALHGIAELPARVWS